jgi:hypothetical protein
MKPEKTGNPQLDWIIAFFIVTLIGTAALWILDISGSVRNVLLSGFTHEQYLGFLASDLFALPLLAVSILGLRRRKFWGYVATQIEMGSWIYSSLGSLVIAVAKGGKDIFVLIWSPVYLVAAVCVIFLTWKIRGRFN